MTTTNKKIKGNGKKPAVENTPASLPAAEVGVQHSQTILEAVTAPIVISRLSDSKVLYANQAMAQMECVDLNSMLSLRTVDFFVDPEDRNNVVARLQQHGQVSEYEVQLKRGDGSLHWALLSARMLDYQGETCVLSSYVDITDLKQAEAASQEEKQRFETILETIRIPTIISRLSDGQVLYANQAIAEISQVSRENLKTLKTLDFYANPGDQEKIRESLRTAGHVDDFEVQFRRADGTLYWGLLSSRIVNYEGEACVLSSYVDITARKQVEQALRDSEVRYSAVVTQATDGVVIIQDNILQFVNEAMANMMGYAAAEMVNTPIINYIAPESRQLIVNRIKARLAGQEVPSIYEARLQRKDGTPIDCELSAGVIEYRGRPADVGMIRDITERKRTEEALKTHDEFSQKQSSVFAELTRSETLYSGDTQAAFAEVTEAAAQTLNIQRSSIWYYNEDRSEIRCMDLFEQGKGHSSGIVLGKADFPAYFKALEDEKVIAAGNAHTDPATCEFSTVYLTPLGINSMLDAPIRLRGRVIGVICNEHVGPFRTWTVEEQNFARTIVDFITVAVETQERKQAEAELQQSEAKLSSALHVSKMGHWEFDIATQMFTFNDQYYSLHGRTAQEVGGYQMSVQRFAQEFVYPEDGPIVGQATQQAIETTDPDFHVEVEARNMHADGKPRWMTVWFRVEKDAQGKTIKLHGVNQDITERKLAQEAIQKSEANYRAIAEFTYGWETWLSPEGEFLYVSPACERISEYPSDAFMDNPRLFSEIAHPEDRSLIEDHLHDHHSTADTKPIEFRIITKSGRVRWISHSCQAIHDATGTWQGRRASNLDITERKQAEEFLRQSEAKLSSALHVSKMGHWEYDVAAGMFTFNDQYYSLHGTTAEKVGGYQISVQKFAQEFVYPEDGPIVGQSTQQAIETTDPNFQVQIEARIMHADGSPRWVTVWFRVEKDVQGRTIKLHGVNQDITERKQTEAALQREKALSDAIINGMPGVFYLFDTQGKMFRWNKQYEQMMGFTPEEAASTNAIDAFADEDKEHAMTAIQRVFVEKQATVEANFLTKDGRRIPHYLTGQVLQFGEELYLAGTGIDITQRKQLEQQIQTALERRGLQVQLTTRVSQSIAAAASLQELYERVVAQVKEQFDYYHTQILRYDNVLEAVVLVNGYGKVGAQMLADGHRLPMGEGLIGTAAATGQTVLRAALENDPDWHPNPLLPDTKGEIAVPIKLGDTILGVLDVQSNVTGALDADDQLLLEGLCGQVAVAIESTRLREEMSERLEEINRLYRAMSHEGWQTYRQTADLPASFMFDQAGLRPVQDTGLAEELFASVPLTVPGGEVIGTLAIADDPQRPISPDDEAFLQQVAEQVALALESARLFEQTQSALGEVRRRASELETVAAVSTTASTVLDPDELLHSVVNLTRERFALYHAHIYLVDPDSQELVLSAGAGEIGKQMLAEGWSIPVNHALSLVAKAYRNRGSVVANDVYHDRESAFLSNRLLPDTRSEMALPLVVGDLALGVFDVQSEQSNYFTPEDVNIYTTLASQVAVALQNARLYVEQKKTVAQLRELDKLKNSFLANMSHELRTPLNSILGFADVILEELDGPLTENMNNDLRLIQKNGQHLLHLINDVLDMAKIEAGRMNLSPENFTACEVLEEVTSITSTLASEKNLALFIEEDTDQNVQIYADRTRLRQVMINLVNNAIKFTETGKIALKVSPISGARILITVKDTGIGIPPDKLEPIFQEFTQVDASSTRKAGGTGLGLPISRRLVEMHGGRLWAESTGIPGDGSTFFVELPVEARITETVEKQVK